MMKMGVTQSTTNCDGGGTAEDRAFVRHCNELYFDLSTNSGPLTFKEKFVSLFGGPVTEYGNLLFHCMFKDSTDASEVDGAGFLHAISKLHAVMLSSEDASNFFFDLVIQSTTDLESALQFLLYVAASCALLTGSTCNVVVQRNSPLLLAMASSITKYISSHNDIPKVISFYQWASVHSPRLLSGLRQWLLTIILPPSDRHTVYHLPLLHCKEERQQYLNIQMWILSGVLSSRFFGAVSSSPGSVDAKEDLPQGGSWSCLYASREHGLSMNRFQHHCFDYKQPSIMIIEFQERDSNQPHSYALALDSEWRDGVYFYGGDDFSCIQLQPTYSVVKRGAKLLSLNERQRGFPTGLRVMASQRYDHCVLEIKPSFEEIRLGEGEWMQIQSVEVWGCGGKEAQETQQRIKEWEKRQILRRREISNKTLRTTWEDSPDRVLLEMGGVTTSRPKENC